MRCRRVREYSRLHVLQVLKRILTRPALQAKPLVLCVTKTDALWNKYDSNFRQVGHPP